METKKGDPGPHQSGPVDIRSRADFAGCLRWMGLGHPCEVGGIFRFGV